MKRKVIIQKNREGYKTFRAPIPKEYIDSMGISEDNRDINIELNNNNNNIVISKTGGQDNEKE